MPGSLRLYPLVLSLVAREQSLIPPGYSLLSGRTWGGPSYSSPFPQSRCSRVIPVLMWQQVHPASPQDSQATSPRSSKPRSLPCVQFWAPHYERTWSSCSRSSGGQRGRLRDWSISRGKAEGAELVQPREEVTLIMCTHVCREVSEALLGGAEQ